MKKLLEYIQYLHINKRFKYTKENCELEMSTIILYLKSKTYFLNKVKNSSVFFYLNKAERKFSFNFSYQLIYYTYIYM